MRARAIGRWLAGIPLLLLLILFALSNTQAVRIGLFPTGLLIDVPLSLAVLGAMGIGFFLGALVVWFAGFRHRRAARRAEATVRLMEARDQEMTTRLPDHDRVALARAR